MTDDLVKRLRELATTGYYTIHNEAADRIEALEVDNRNLRMELLSVLGQKIESL